MWTKKSHFVCVFLHIKYFRWPFVVPLFIFWELIDAVEDLLLFFGWATPIDVLGTVRAIEETAQSLVQLGRFDLVDVDTGSKDEKVKIKICLR